ncbi:class III lanthionine synthetase LanKC [Longispora albida]|uniref:class III lanthionine synthetase LanKC n=1 Tax=Longispora albida TaxID=203523 RepID=UPI0003660B65|nr:class III lanthionine synthetase LanKC [Longispora albida]
MDDRYEAFSMADPSFYDAMHSEATAGSSFPVADRALPDGWYRHEQDDWLVFRPQRGRRLPEQGWKIHASAALGSADQVLDAVWDYCVPRGIGFKFLRSAGALTARLSKYAPRGFSGKLVTIYPADDAGCETILTELGRILDGVPNPYILTDLRWGSGPLHVRYGAFVNRYTVDEATGEVVGAIADPDGNLVPDRRDPVFQTPPWVTLPEFLAPHLAARAAVTVADLPYTIDGVLHFSNGGGIYTGEDTRTGERVVLKEGRPHAGLDAWGQDAVRRVEAEFAMLRRLEGIPGIPRAHDLLTVGEHCFLVMDHVGGQVLSAALVSRYPLADPLAGPDDFDAYTTWAMDIHRQVASVIAAVHERGVVYGDLHLFNVMVGDDGGVTLLDFEVASPVEEAKRAGLGNQGFSAPRAMTGFDVDLYSLACLRLALFLPMTNLLWLHRLKARHYAEIIQEHFPVPAAFLTPAVDLIAPPEVTAGPSPRIEPDPAGWPQLRDDLARAIVASATPGRDDRLFPGDPEQFEVGGLGLAHGASGVLYALAATGAGRYPQFEEWLLKRVANPRAGTRLGLYDGLHGAAFTLCELGYRQEALDAVDVFLRENWEALGPDLSGGLAGAGLNLLYLAGQTGDPRLRAAAHRAAELVAAHNDRDTGGTTSGGREPYAGLMRGGAGRALLLLRTYDDTGDSGYLDQAAVALRADLRRCRVRDNGVLEVDEGWRTMPYLDVGSIGIGLVLGEYLARRPDEQFAEASRGIELAASSPMYILPGLFSGRAGVLHYLAARPGDRLADPLVRRQVRGLAWHALPYGGGMAFPGTGLLRLSMDLATGTAGVLLALGTVLHDEPVAAPFLGPVPAPQAPAPSGAGSPHN